MIEAFIFGAYWVLAAALMARRELRYRRAEREWSPTRRALVALAHGRDTDPGATGPVRTTSSGVSTAASNAGL